MIKLTTLYTLLILMIPGSDFHCEKCDMEKVRKVNENLENLTPEIVGEFLCTFDTICHVNVEFSQWSNRTLFKVLKSSPETFFQGLEHFGVDKETIIREIEEPTEEVDLQAIYTAIKQTSVPVDTDTAKKQILNSIILAAEKGGQQIK